MKKSLFLSLALLAAVPAVQAVEAEPLKLKGHVVTATPGAARKVKTVKNLNPVLKTEENKNSLDESFENPDKVWPVGWTTDLTNDNDWYIYAPGMSGISAADGYYVAAATCFELHDASWLISPKVKVVANDELMFELYFDVRALYVWDTEGDDKTVDTEDGLILKRENAENMKVCVREPGGQWQELYNLWDVYGKLGYHEIMDDYEYPEFRPFRISLADYAGKEVEIGFCHSYTNDKYGHGMFLDAVKVGLPPIATTYGLPMNQFFLGISNTWDGAFDTAIAPPYVDRTWPSLVDEPVTSAEWSYVRLADNETFTYTQGPSELVANYTPYYDENPATAITAYSFPTLSVKNDNGATGQYTYANGDGFIFVTASPELPLKDGGTLNYGYATFNLSDDVSIYNVDFDVAGYGYGPTTKEWWTNHYFDGDQQTDDYAEIVSNINFYYDQGTPMVVNGVRVAASVMCDPAAKFKMELIALNDEFVPSEVLATQSITGADLITIDASVAPFPTTKILEFKFDEPVVVEGKNIIAQLTGFNSDKVTYYKPIQSYESSEYCFAFAGLEIYAPSMGHQTPVVSMVPAIDLDTDANCSYLMFLDGCTPWLRADEDSFTASLDRNFKTFDLDSSYPAAELKFSGEDGAELPAWLKIEPAGQYGDATMKVTVLQGGTAPEQFKLVASAPGVSKTFTINRGVWTGGISSVTTDSPVVARSYFDISGRQLSTEPASGIYMVRTTHADGTTTVTKTVK